jgi:hypothetical protein
MVYGFDDSWKGLHAALPPTPRGGVPVPWSQVIPCGGPVCSELLCNNTVIYILKFDIGIICSTFCWKNM